MRLMSEEPVVWLPLFVRRQTQFERELRSFLPPDHPLRASPTGH